MNEAETRAELFDDIPKESLKVKLYKFRPLATDEDFNRLKAILETGEFWCSKFSDLNDLMEGVYIFINYSSIRTDLIDLIFGEKVKYKICSFSNEKAFSNPVMWGYYANGFKGVAVEIEVGKEEVKKIKYVRNTPSFSGKNPNKEAVKILTTKLLPWKHECEYRFLENNDNNNDRNNFKIGKITALYYGDPYGTTQNNIIANSEALTHYQQYISNILKYSNKIKICPVKIKDCKVIPNNP